MSAETSVGGQRLPATDVRAVSDCLRTTRSIRRFLPQDVDDSSIEFVLRHATQAGSAKNRQPWRFIVVRDRTTRDMLAAWYRRGWDVMARKVREVPDAYTASRDHRDQMRHGEVLARLFGTSPVIVVPCYVPGPRNPADFFAGASIYPALQNLLLAARSIGLGATLTTVQGLDIDITAQLRTILGLPDVIVPAAVIPLGWPATRFGTVRRHPVDAVTYAERWGRAWPSATGADQRTPLIGSHHG